MEPTCFLKASSISFGVEGKEIFLGLDLELPARGYYSLKGANGSGKSTLLGTLSGHLKAQKGTIFLKGRKAARFLFMLGGGQTDLALASLLPFLLALFLGSSLYPLALMAADGVFLAVSYGGSYAQAMGLSAYEGIPIVAFAACSLWALALLVPLFIRILSSFLGKRK